MKGLTGIIVLVASLAIIYFLYVAFFKTAGAPSSKTTKNAEQMGISKEEVQNVMNKPQQVKNKVEKMMKDREKKRQKELEKYSK